MMINNSQMQREKSDNELMEEFASCSLDAFKQVYYRYKIKIFNFVLRNYLQDNDLTEEVLQKTFITVYEYKYRYKKSYIFSTWIYTIAKNLALNEIKRNKRFIPYEQNENYRNDTIYENDKEEILKLVKSIISKMKPDYREVITLRYFDELSFEEISLITQKNGNTVRSLARRSLLLIKEEMKKYGYK